MESPNTGKMKTGLLVAGIGLILGAFIGFGGFGFVGTLILAIGGILMLTGAGSYPGAKGTIGAGFALIMVGFIIGIVAWVMTPSLFLLTPPTDLAAYLNALATGLLLSFVAGLLTWIGVIIMPMKVTTGAGKGLAMAGGILGLIGVVLVFVMVYLTVAALVAAIGGGTPPNFNSILAAIAGLIIGAILGLVGSILAGVGYIIGRNKLVPATM